eukprot:TRINITY_DN2675_c0_g2_i1.p1 TRINITY_DN2675_c0_g2~~TRINITY_DN2675_c0_g2_i1.p1  ORF type:complete len:164 (-),score=46.78 TRINITY_DN2675_c0_g2_i1:360-851(-)
MNGYSKINASTTIKSSKSRSIDFSDLSFSPPPSLPEPKQNPNPNPISKAQLPQYSKTHESLPDQEQEDEVGEVFGVILSRNCSVSSSSSQRFKVEDPGNLQSAVKRAFSMRRSSSVSEGYCRIHDQSDPSFPPLDDVKMQTRSRKKRGKIFKACKRLIGLFNH